MRVTALPIGRFLSRRRSLVNFLGIALGLQLLLPTSGGLAQTQFTVETVDEAGGATSYFPDYPSLALDANDTPHVGYVWNTPDAGASDRSIRYAVRGPSGWQTEIIQHGAGASNTSIAVDPSGVPHMAYASAGNTPIALYYATRGGAGWTIETVTMRQFNYQGGYNSVKLLLDPVTASPLLFFRDAESQSLKLATRGASGWQFEDIGPSIGGITGAIQANGIIHIAHIRYDSALALYVAEYVHGVPGAWQRELVSTDPTLNAALALGPDGEPVVSYWRRDPFNSAAPKALKLAIRSTSGWTNEIVDSTGSQSAPCVDEQGQVRILYWVGPHPYYALRSAGGWSSTLVDTDTRGGQGDASDLKVDSNGVSRMVYSVAATASGSGAVKYAEPAPPSIGDAAGRVYALCPAEEPLLGVRVDAYETGSGDLVGTAVTDVNGDYRISDLPVGQYVLTVVTPLGYTTSSTELAVAVPAGATVYTDWALECNVANAGPRSIGYWKHQLGVATGGQGHAEVDAATLCTLLDLVQAHFNSNLINPVVVYQPPSSSACDDKLSVCRDLLNLKGSAAMIDRARQQLMSMLLNVAAGYIGPAQVVSYDGASLSQAITYCDNMIDDPAGDYELAKTIADLINNGMQVPGGMIPLGTQEISYAHSRGPLSLRVARNGAGGGVTFLFSLDHPCAVSVDVFDVRGRLVAHLRDRKTASGQQSVVWDGRTSGGSRVARSIYFARLSTIEGVAVTRVPLVTR